jgi:nitrogen-specific signal transduction histidine kinase
MNTSPLTHFASADRSPQNEIIRQYQSIIENKDLITFLDGIDTMISVLNANRQVVFANKLILNMMGTDDIYTVLGRRLGEIFGCTHAFDVNGCGTSEYCSVCGAVRTMLACNKHNQNVVDECSLTSDTTKTTFDLRVQSTHIRMKEEDFTICSLFDIGDEKRRSVMERMFFHDIMNTVNGINGIAQILPGISPEKLPLYTPHLSRLVNSLIDEIGSHRVLTLAEKNEYITARHVIESLDLAGEEADKYRTVAALESKDIRIETGSENHTFVSDRTLLSRVLGNMIKNALEAEYAGAVIRIGVQKEEGNMLHFYVQNSSVIRQVDCLKIFNRSFSTKGEGRGLGTYCMKLLTEKYLNGKISFISNSQSGTIFSVRIPIAESINT